MEQVTIALGSNLGNRLAVIREAGKFLREVSKSDIIKSSIWESEPIGGALYSFLNCTVRIETSLSPIKLLDSLKKQEVLAGREKQSKRWAPRILDLDIIRYGNLTFKKNELIIPHSEYQNRLFVLLPMQETDPDWIDPVTGSGLRELIHNAPKMAIHKTDHSW